MQLINLARSFHASVVDRWLPQRVVYHHVPKCGGTSVSRALRKRYLLSQATILTIPANGAIKRLMPDASNAEQWNQTLKFREAMLLYLMHCDTRCIAAHVAFSSTAFEAFKSRYAFVTVLREPVSRYISHFYHSLNRDDHSAICESLDTFAGSPRGQSFGARYVEYFRGSPSIDNLRTRASIDAAKENLRQFSAVGFMDQMPSFERQLRATLSVKVAIGHENKGRTAKGSSSSVPPDLRKRIEMDCAPDIEVYEYARTLFGR
jgi:hypothetical protein